MNFDITKYSQILSQLLMGNPFDNSNGEFGEETESNIFSLSLDDIKDLFTEQLQGDTFVSSINSSNLIFQNGQFTTNNQADENNYNFTNLLNNFIQNDSVQTAIDTDANGTLSMDEMNEFIEAVEGLDQNANDISINDILSAMQSIENGTFGENTTEEPVVTTGETDVTSTDIQNQNLKPIRNNGARSGRGSSGSSYSGGDGATQAKTTPKNLTLEELQSKKTEKQGELKTAQDNVSAAISGETDTIKAAQQDCDAKKQAYEEALKNDKNISDELKGRQQENQTNIDTQNGIINDIKNNIHSKENEITSQNSIISEDKSTIGALESSVANLKAQSSDDPEVQKDIASKLSAAEARLSEARKKLTRDQETLRTLEGEKAGLETDLGNEEDKLTEFEGEKTAIESEISANCGAETILAMNEYKMAEANVKSIQATEISAAKAVEAKVQAEIDSLNTEINTKSAKKIEKEFSVNRLDDPEQLYKTMGLEEMGLDYKVFESAIIGYNNLTDEQKATGFLGIFDTTQNRKNERYYLLDLNNFEVVDRSELKTGSGNMGNIKSANRLGSGATLSGFEQVGKQYYSSKMGKNALRLIGLEQGINDQAERKGTVVHWTQYQSTLGCKGFPPIRTKSGKVDSDATDARMHELFPAGCIVYTHPTDDDYWKMSKLYAA